MCVLTIVASYRTELSFEDLIYYGEIVIFVDSTSAVKQGFLVTMLRNVPTEKFWNTNES